MAKAPAPDALARAVRWAIILFFAYMFWHTYVGMQPPILTSNTADHALVKTKDCDTNLLQKFPAYTMSLLPAALPAVHIEETKTGTGVPAVCGQLARMDYSYSNQSGTPLYHNTPLQAATFAPISDNVLLSRSVIGMKTGGERTITIPPTQGLVADGKNIKDDVSTVKVSLHGLKPETLPSSPIPLRMIDTKLGTGQRAACGDTVTADITVWKLDGTKLFSTLDSKPVTFTLGTSEIAYGIEQGAIGMMEGSQRTLILPPAYNEPLISKKSSPYPSMQFPPGEIVLVEITRLPAVEKPASSPITK